VYAHELRRAFTGNLEVKSGVEDAPQPIQDKNQQQIRPIAKSSGRIGTFLQCERPQFYQLFLAGWRFYSP
jgi:hypothetical protein